MSSRAGLVGVAAWACAVTLTMGCDREPAPPPPGGLEACAAQPFPQLKDECYVEAAARTAREGDATSATAACAALGDPAWKDECHFRAGEELARAGKLVDGLGLCGKAGRFATFCTTHAGWGVPPSDEPLDAWLPGVSALPERLHAEATDILRARWWFNRYFGTGTADPAAARSAPPEELAHARGAWALEAIRLVDGDLEKARAAWSDGTVLTGAALDRRIGRNDAPFRIPGEDALPHIRTFGGSMRLVGETADEDLDVALLEGLYFRERSGAEVFAPFLRDPRPRVRYTALRCYRTLPSPDAEAVLTAMRDDPDPIVAAHVADALKYRTWLGKANAPGLKEFGASGPPPGERGPANERHGGPDARPAGEPGKR